MLLHPLWPLLKPYQNYIQLIHGAYFIYIGQKCTKCCIYITIISPIYHKNQGSSHVAEFDFYQDDLLVYTIHCILMILGTSNISFFILLVKNKNKNWISLPQSTRHILVLRDHCKHSLASWYFTDITHTKTSLIFDIWPIYCL